jgi:hypothetical protein
MNRFRPQDMPTRYRMRERRRTGRVETYNWQSRVQWYPAGWKANHVSIGRRFGQLHYLACHAPRPIQLKWRRAYQLFCNRHFGDAGRASLRYLNRYTSHSWL